MLKSTILKVHAAAVLFAERGGCSAKKIAEILNIPVNSVYYYAKQPEWNKTLDTLGYTGSRAFVKKTTRDIQKEFGELVAQARGIYLMERRSGANHKKAVSSVCRNLGLKRRRINDWAAKFDWEATL